MASLLTAVRDLGRLREIVGVLARHGFGESLNRMGLSNLAPNRTTIPPAGDAERRLIAWQERVRLVLQELGPSFIKLGQIISTRPDLMPAELVTELKKLQDDVPPVSFEAIKHQVEEQLARTIDEVYVRFDERPLATASIGQVHRARLRAEYDEPGLGPDGTPLPQEEREVVVKVQRPGVKDTVERDLELLHILAQIVDRSIEEARIYDPIGLVNQFDRSITAEMDFSVEATNGERFRRNFDGWTNVAFPHSYKQASSKRVLTLEFFDGQKIYAAVKGGFSGPAIAKSSLGFIVKMIFEDGFFHADPHPGNIIIMGTPEAPIIGLIDLGMVGRLSPEMRDKTIRLMVAASTNDPRGVADALYSIGRPTKKVDMIAYRAEVEVLAEKYLGRPLKEIEMSAMIKDLVDGAIRYGLEIPTDFMMTGKALMTIEGIGKELDPNLDVFGEARPYFVDLLKKRLSPEEIGVTLLRTAEKYAGLASDLPQHAVEVLDDLRMGRLQIKTEESQLAPAFDRFGRRIFNGMVASALVVASSIAYTSTSTHRRWVALAMFVGAVYVWGTHVSKDAIVSWWGKGKR
ncbi:MAG: ABC1 kinase family protein [Polyangiales bacterium]